MLKGGSRPVTYISVGYPQVDCYGAYKALADYDEEVHKSVTNACYNDLVIHADSSDSPSVSLKHSTFRESDRLDLCY